MILLDKEVTEIVNSPAPMDFTEEEYSFDHDLRGYEFEAMYEVSSAMSAYLITEQLFPK